MKTLYLHVGLHKTATTSLQGFFGSNRAQLKETGVYYPETGLARGSAHHHLVSAIRFPEHPHFKAKKSFDAYLLELKEEAIEHSAMLISSEIFSEKIDLQALSKINDLAENIKVIIYLRRQDLYLESRYSQLVKTGIINKGFMDFYAARGSTFVDFDKICDQWAQLFGEENIIVRVFEKGQLKGGSIYSDFLSIFNLKLELGFTVPTNRINVSPGRDDLEFIRLLNFLSKNASLNIQFPSFKDYQKAAIPYPFFNPEERASLLAQYADTNAYVAKKYLKRPDGQLFYESPNDIEWHSYPGLSHGQIAERLKAILNRKPEQFVELRNLIHQGLSSKDTDINHAARTLNESTEVAFKQYFSQAEKEIFSRQAVDHQVSFSLGATVETSKPEDGIAVEAPASDVPFFDAFSKPIRSGQKLLNRLFRRK